MNDDRIPPQSIEAEMSLIGSILLNGLKMTDIIDDIRSEYFYNSKHQKIYTVMCELYGNSLAVDIVSVSDELRKRKQLEDVGGSFYLTELCESVPSAENVLSYARLVKEKWAFRKAISDTNALSGMAFDEEPIEDILEKIGNLSLINIMSNKDESFSEILHAMYEEIDARMEGKYK